MLEKEFASKEIVFREGEIGDFAYIIQEGQIEILKHADHGEVVLATLEAGNVFGEMALFEPGAKRSASARALGHARLEMLSLEDFQTLFGQCPPSLVPFLKSLMTRLRDQNARVAAKERATVLLDMNINRITVRPGSPVIEGSFEPALLHVANLPFSIGGHVKGSEPPDQNLVLTCDEHPAFISHHHCTIERHGESIFLVDQGSRFGTLVNNQPIGRGKPSFKAPLVVGENRVVLGGLTSPYALSLLCE